MILNSLSLIMELLYCCRCFIQSVLLNSCFLFMSVFRIDYSLTSRFRWSCPERRLVESILTVELTYSSAGLHSRYHLLRNLLQDDDYDKSDATFWTWIFIWFSFFPSSPYQFFPSVVHNSPRTPSQLSSQSSSLLSIELEASTGSSPIDNNSLFFFKESVETHLSSCSSRNSPIDPLMMTFPKEAPFK